MMKNTLNKTYFWILALLAMMAHPIMAHSDEDEPQIPVSWVWAYDNYYLYFKFFLDDGLKFSDFYNFRCYNNGYYVQVLAQPIIEGTMSSNGYVFQNMIIEVDSFNTGKPNEVIYIVTATAIYKKINQAGIEVTIPFCYRWSSSIETPILDPSQEPNMFVGDDAGSTCVIYSKNSQTGN